MYSFTFLSNFRIKIFGIDIQVGTKCTPYLGAALFTIGMKMEKKYSNQYQILKIYLRLKCYRFFFLSLAVEYERIRQSGR